MGRYGRRGLRPARGRRTVARKGGSRKRSRRVITAPPKQATGGWWLPAAPVRTTRRTVRALIRKVAR